ncbi:glycosyltransferase family 20 protein, partial [Zopfia rhizophila CBS 207.26]
VYLLFNSVSKTELAALYAVVDACVISSIRYGFNVVSMEYVACQQRRHGLLVFSEFAGAVDTLPDAVIVNPWDTEKFADALHRSFSETRSWN